MTSNTEQAITIRDAIEVVEEAYEFMLAYAAQGRKQEGQEGGGESQIRNYLKRLVESLGSLETASKDGVGGPEGEAFVERFLDDLAVTKSAAGLLLATPSITSDMVDNTNSLVPVRALLTEIFFIDQALLPQR